MGRPLDLRILGRALDHVDSWLRWWVPRSEIPGCTVAVSVGSDVLLSAGYGLADPAAGVAMAADDVFRVASHSKTFTAAAVVRLVEGGRVRLDDAVADHLAWLAEHDDERWRRVTVRQLLSHGGGATRDGDTCDHWQLAVPFPDAEALRAGVLSGPLVTDANVAMKYSNIGYAVLGQLIEAVSGSSFATYVADHLTRPLGLTATVAEPTGPVVAAHGTKGPDGTRRTIPDLGSAALAAATGVASTAPELCRWLGALMIGSGRVVGDDAKREMQRVQWHVEGLGQGRSMDYGLGLVLGRIGERRTFGHSGGWPGHITHSAADPGDGLVVSVCTNCIDGAAGDVVAGVFGVIDAHLAGGPDLAEGLLAVEGRYVDLWRATDLAVIGRQVHAVDPSGWAPFALPPTTLEPEGGSDDLRIVATSSFGSPGQVVTRRPDGAISFAGMTMWPEAGWPAQEARLLG